MSHRLEKDTEDTKYPDYKEPKTSRRFPNEDMPADSRTKGDVQAQDAESIWNMARESDCGSPSRGSLTDERARASAKSKRSSD